MFHRLKNALRPLWHRLRPRRNRPWTSETSKCRGRLARFCGGDGVDLGFGGDPISETAVRIDLPAQYASVGAHAAQLRGDAAQLCWFQDGALDYVFSSHLLEDFQDTKAVLCEWLRVLKPGGRLVLFCPDEQRFRTHCAHTGQPYNPAHKHAHFSLDFVKGLLAELGGTSVVHENPNVDIYSWELVVCKLPPGPAATQRHLSPREN